MSSFTDRLVAAKDAACLTVSDMALWFEVSRSAMNYWIAGVRAPLSAKARQLEPLLVTLEMALSVTDDPSLRLPVPLRVRQQDRRFYIEKVKEYATNKFSKAGPAGRRKKVLRRHTS